MAETVLTVGKQAPAFTLPNQDGAKVVLKDQRGQWVVLYFYPKDDTPGCTTQACEFTAERDQFSRLGAAVIGVSFLCKMKLADLTVGLNDIELIRPLFELPDHGQVRRNEISGWSGVHSVAYQPVYETIMEFKIRCEIIPGQSHVSKYLCHACNGFLPVNPCR